MSQPELFHVKPKAVKKRTVEKSDKAKWTKYYPGKAKTPYKCDFCLQNLAEDPKAPAARLAQHIRKEGSTSLYLCYSHANDQRRADGLKAYRRAT